MRILHTSLPDYLKMIIKAWFPYDRNCREHVVTIVRVVFATKYGNMKKSLVATCSQQFTTVTTVSSR